MFMFLTLVYITGALLSYRWMDEKMPNEDKDDKIPFILWSMLWPIVWTLEIHKNIHNE